MPHNVFSHCWPVGIVLMCGQHVSKGIAAYRVECCTGQALQTPSARARELELQFQLNEFVCRDSEASECVANQAKVTAIATEAAMAHTCRCCVN